MSWDARVDPEYLTDDLRAEVYDPESLAFERRRRLEADSLVPLADLCVYIHAAAPVPSTVAAAGSAGVPLVNALDVIAMWSDPQMASELPRLPLDQVERTYGPDTLLVVLGDSVVGADDGVERLLDASTVPELSQYMPIGESLYVLKPKPGVGIRYLMMILESDAVDDQLRRSSRLNAADPTAWVRQRPPRTDSRGPLSQNSRRSEAGLATLQGLLVPSQESALGRQILGNTYWSSAWSPVRLRDDVVAATQPVLVTPITPRDAARNALALVTSRFRSRFGRAIEAGMFFSLERAHTSDGGLIARAVEQIDLRVDHGSAASLHLENGWELAAPGRALETGRTLLVNPFSLPLDWSSLDPPASPAESPELSAEPRAGRPLDLESLNRNLRGCQESTSRFGLGDLDGRRSAG